MSNQIPVVEVYQSSNVTHPQLSMTFPLIPILILHLVDPLNQQMNFAWKIYSSTRKDVFTIFTITDITSLSKKYLHTDTVTVTDSKPYFSERLDPVSAFTDAKLFCWLSIQWIAVRRSTKFLPDAKLFCWFSIRCATIRRPPKFLTPSTSPTASTTRTFPETILRPGKRPDPVRNISYRNPHNRGSYDG